GAWFSYKGEKVGQGLAATRAWLRAHPEIDAELTQQLREILFKKDG
ncbi:MAG TPA: DNA recombination/repair protein RecA, partial [Erysipelotrichaceae bacterium]|nr:DNA recombination/repair protein RecA [Erysipelotrichaceae bacterium]